jgi:hypothetical protein
LVELLSRKGLDAIQGAAPDFPWSDVPPFAIVLFDVLEHFPEPAEIIGSFVKRFPQTAVLASVPSPTRARLLIHGERSPSDLPPNHFVRWTPRALEVFFRGQGFRKVTVTAPPPPGSELLPGLGQLLKSASRPVPAPGAAAAARTAGLPRRVGITAMLWMHKAYQLAADCVGAPAAWHAHARGASASSMLVVAR